MDPRVVKALEIEAANLQAGKTSGLNILALRDKLAKALLPTIYADAIRVNEAEGFPNSNWRDGVASEAYRFADAMLAARNA